MKAKEYLMQLKDIDNLIATESEELLHSEELALRTTQSCDSERVQTSGTSDKVGEAATSTVDLENVIIQNIQELISIKNNAIRIINLIPAFKLRTVLLKYYVQNKTLEKTAVEMDKSYQWAYELHKRALKEFDKIRDSEEKGVW